MPSRPAEALLRRSRAAAAGLAGAAVLLPSAGGAAPAQGGGEGLFEVQSALAPVGGSFSIGLDGTAYQVEKRREPGSRADRIVADGGTQITLGIGGRAEIWGRFNAAFTHHSPASALSYRDGLFGAKVALLASRHLAIAASGNMNVPWGNRARGFSNGTWDPGGDLLVTVPLPESNPLSSAFLHLNVGYRHRGDQRGRTYDGFPLYYLEPVYPGGDGDRVDLRGALEFRSRRLSLFAEAILDRMVSPDISFVEGPIWVTPGFRLALNDHVSFLLASKIAISADDLSTTRFRPPEEMFPDWQVCFGVTWSRFGPDTDRDGDGVPDYRDRCPETPEDHDGVGDQDGCPETDFDGDGIPDVVDKCPEVPEDFDGVDDDDGCPEADVQEAPAAPAPPASGGGG